MKLPPGVRLGVLTRVVTHLSKPDLVTTVCCDTPLTNLPPHDLTTLDPQEMTCDVYAALVNVLGFAALIARDPEYGPTEREFGLLAMAMARKSLLGPITKPLDEETDNG